MRKFVNRGRWAQPNPGLLPSQDWPSDRGGAVEADFRKSANRAAGLTRHQPGFDPAGKRRSPAPGIAGKIRVQMTGDPR